jgi:hypothetical protein
MDGVLHAEARTDGGAAGRAACGRELLAVLLGDGGRLRADRAALHAACVRRLAPPAAPAALRQLAVRVVAGARRDGGRGALRRALTRTCAAVPDVEGARSDGCALCRAPHGRRFADAALNRHVAAVFAAVAAGAPGVSLSRYNLFHAHLFASAGCIGLLFHAREYPRREPGGFDVHLGRCQSGSTLAWDERAMALRNVLYVVPMARGATAALAVLHTAPGTLLHDELLAPGVRALHTVYEEDLGTPLADVNYLHAAPRLLPEHRLLVCV